MTAEHETKEDAGIYCREGDLQVVNQFSFDFRGGGINGARTTRAHHSVPLLEGLLLVRPVDRLGL
jgi:hypothetical protein